VGGESKTVQGGKLRGQEQLLQPSKIATPAWGGKRRGIALPWKGHCPKKPTCIQDLHKGSLISHECKQNLGPYSWGSAVSQSREGRHCLSLKKTKRDEREIELRGGGNAFPKEDKMGHRIELNHW